MNLPYECRQFITNLLNLEYLRLEQDLMVAQEEVRWLEGTSVAASQTPRAAKDSAKALINARYGSIMQRQATISRVLAILSEADKETP